MLGDPTLVVHRPRALLRMLHSTSETQTPRVHSVPACSDSYLTVNGYTDNHHITHSFSMLIGNECRVHNNTSTGLGICTLLHWMCRFMVGVVQYAWIQCNSDTAHSVSKRILRPTVQGWVLFLGLQQSTPTSQQHQPQFKSSDKESNTQQFTFLEELFKRRTAVRTSVQLNLQERPFISGVVSDINVLEKKNEAY